MFTSSRFPGVLALGLVLGLLVSAPAAPPNKKNPTVAAIVQLADSLPAENAALKAKKIVDEHDSCDISRVFAPGKNGGAGIGSAVAAGHKDSIRDLVQNWSGAKPPSKQELQAHRKDLLQMARVLQAMAELAPFRMPHFRTQKNDKQAAEWRQVALGFKAVTRDLYDAIGAVDAAQTRKVAVRLQQTCSACHTIVGFGL